MKSIILLSSTTSATGSIYRIVQLFTKGKLVPAKYFDDLSGLPASEIRSSVPPARGHLLLLNKPPLFNKSLDVSQYRFIVNFRDPRDRLCNLYHWQFVHPTPGETEDARAERIARVREMGINEWVEQACNEQRPEPFDNIYWLLQNPAASDRIVLTYARLCCDFDSFIDLLAAFLGERIGEDLRSEVENERVENLGANRQWIGNYWSGSDTFPGRYRRELDARRIEIVTRHYEPVLRRMAQYDPDFAEQYLEGLPPDRSLPKSHGTSTKAPL